MIRALNAIPDWACLVLAVIVGLGIYVGGIALVNHLDPDGPHPFEPDPAPTTICEPMPDDSGRWQCYAHQEKETRE